MLSVIIPHLNQAAELGECLHTLAAQTYPTDQFEIIVVDTAHGDRRALSGRAPSH